MACVLTPLDSLTAVYHRRSGTTHLLAEPLPEILATLGAAPATIPALAERLAMEYGLAMNVETTALLSQRLADLEAIGLVWPL